MSPEDRAAAEQIVRELERRKQRTKIDTFYQTPENRAGYPVHMQFFEAGKTHRQRLALAANRVGKALKHGTKVATPSGWKSIETLVTGDLVIAGDGSITTITGVYPQGEVNLFSISFDGVHDIQTCGQHLWKYQNPNARFPYRQSHGEKQNNPFFGQWTVGNTESLVGYGKSPKRRVVVPMANEFNLENSILPMNPYALGLLLGDGGLSGKSIKFSTSDEELIDELRKHFKVVYYDKYDYGVNGAVGIIRELGLHGLTSEKKFIPKQYLYSDSKSRLALLQGLMDTDGSIHGHCNMEFSTSSDDLAEGFEWLASSLGIKTRLIRRYTKDQNGNGKPSWRIVVRSGVICPFRLSRKVARWRPLKETSNWVIHSIKESGKGLATCIEVAHDSHTFVIEHGIVTHNTEGMGGYETVLHLTGRYPDWWNGKRFDKPGEWWIGGDTATTVRDIIQSKLLGNVGDFGTGLIPGQLLIDTSNKRGVPDAVENIYVKHVSGSRSVVQLKSYDQGREAWQGTEKQGVWLDEEPPMSIYTEALTRTMTTNGIVLCTFTPMNGMTEVTESFMSVDKPDSKFMCTASWDDALHLDEATKKEMLEQYPLHERDARSKGIPTIGVGRVYPVDMETILVDPFDLPKHWVRGYALDVGWNKTAALWGALDRDSDILYLYSEHYQGMVEPAVHASAIKARGEMTGYIDPAAKGGSQADGEKLIQLYRNEGLKLAVADNAKEAGVYDVYQRMTSGRIKIFRTLVNLQKELPIYHRDGTGAIVKKNDHLCDCLRYLVRATPVLTYASEKSGHYGMTQSGVQYRTSRPTRGNRYGD